MAMTTSKIFNIILIGGVGAGKTSYLNLLKTKKFKFHKYEPTLGYDLTYLDIVTNDGSYKLNIWDISGDFNYQNGIENFCKTVAIDGVIIFKTQSYLSQYINNLIELLQQKKRNIILIDIWYKTDHPDENKNYNNHSQFYLDKDRATYRLNSIYSKQENLWQPIRDFLNTTTQDRVKEIISID
jgi:GTPase SAR1 family protein